MLVLLARGGASQSLQDIVTTTLEPDNRPECNNGKNTVLSERFPTV
jgi:hypothetical protein